MDILKDLEKLKSLKIEKDKLLDIKSSVPELVFDNRKSNVDDCIRDESGKVLQC